MTITIDLLPEETTRLAAEAHRQGLSLEEYLYRRILPSAGAEGLDLSDKAPRRKRNIMDLQGLGKEIWKGVDVRQYLDELRDEE